MKRYAMVVGVVLAMTVGAHAQGPAPQQARQVISGTGVPTASCTPGPSWTSIYLRTTTGVLYYCSAAPNTWSVLTGGGGGGGGITNSAPANVIMKSDGTNAVASAIMDASGDVTITNRNLVVLDGSGNGVIRTSIADLSVALGDVDQSTNGTSLQVDDSTSTVSISATNGLELNAGGTVAGNVGLFEGSATAVVADTVQLQAPAAVTGYNLVFPAAAGGGAINCSNSSNVVTCSFTGLTLTASTGTLTIANSKTLTASNSLTLAGTDSTTMTFPEVSASVGFRNIPQNSQSADYTFVLTDSGKHILHPAADTNNRTFTIPANASVAYPLGTTISIINLANVVTLAITSDTLILMGAGSTGSRSLAANSVATIVKVGTTTWIVSGNGIS